MWIFFLDIFTRLHFQQRDFRIALMNFSKTVHVLMWDIMSISSIKLGFYYITQALERSKHFGICVIFSVMKTTKKTFSHECQRNVKIYTNQHNGNTVVQNDGLCSKCQRHNLSIVSNTKTYTKSGYEFRNVYLMAFIANVIQALVTAIYHRT